ncbi:MAG: NTP transferase domain-containing protein [Gammaproteobacteria bacterium]|jgi:MurNAc alpha-1-phosphate uridylyltransferase|nr:NTP transferase domain-containing protein [Gammaproteobacteria bacterium]
MILAAGRGERLRPLTDSIPKPMVEAGGETLIERHIRALARAGVSEIVVNLAWLGGRIVERLGQGSRYGVTLVYSPEGETALDTGGGIRRALPLLGRAPFWVVNADIHTDYDFAAAPLQGDALASLVLVPNPEHNARGDFTLEDGLLGSGTGKRYTFAGIGRYRPEFFAGCAEGVFPLAPLIREHAAAGRVQGELHTGAWHDPGTPARLAELRRRLGR